MSETHPHIYALPVLDHWILVAPRAGVRALVNPATVRALARGDRHDGLGDLPEVLRQGTGPAVAETIGSPLRPPFLGLITTRGCNLACAYCGFADGIDDRERMSYQRAVAAVDWMAETVVHQGRDTLEVHFFGGEPLVAADVVEVAVHHARSVAGARGLRAHFEIATNGVCNSGTARFLGDYVDSVVLSLDGPEHIHDRQRGARTGGSFERTYRSGKIIATTACELALRVCVTTWNVSLLNDIVRWIARELRPVTIVFELLKPNTRSKATGLQPPDPYQFAGRFFEASGVAADHGIRAIFAAAATATLRTSFCPVGNDSVIVSPDGRVSGCYLMQAEWQGRGMDLDLGWLDGDGVMRLENHRIDCLRELVRHKPRCERCFCRYSCAGGCHVTETYPGCRSDYSDFCVATRLITACSALAELGWERLAMELLADRQAMTTLALQSSDRLGEHGVIRG